MTLGLGERERAYFSLIDYLLVCDVCSEFFSPSLSARERLHHIMETCPCNVDPLTPHFYILKLGCTGVYNIFLFLL